MKLSTAVLAGGKSLRANGYNKSFLIHKDQTFIEKILDQLSGFDEVLVSVNAAGKTEKEYEHLPCTLVKDEFEGFGPLGGIHACLKRCRNEHLFVCATDMPGIKKSLVEFMAEFVSPSYDCFVLLSKFAVQPLCAIYTKALVPLIEELFMNKKYSPLAVFDNSRVKYIPLKYSCFDESVISNINYLSDLEKLKKLENAPITKKPAVFAVSGAKNSGKTTLVTKLAAALKEEGYAVGVIKHDGHDFEADPPETDTSRARQAGCNPTMIYSKTKFAFVKIQNDAGIEDLIGYFGSCDVVIIEGLKHSGFPKIEVAAEKLVCSEDSIIAIASDNNCFTANVPVFKREDISQIVKAVKNRLLF